MPAHNKQGVRSSHTGMVTRACAMCPETFRHIALPAFVHAPRNGTRVRAIPWQYWAVLGSTASLAPGGTASKISLCTITNRRSALADPAQRRIRLTLNGQVLAIAPSAALALVVPALTAGGADHEAIVAQRAPLANDGRRAWR